MGGPHFGLIIATFRSQVPKSFLSLKFPLCNPLLKLVLFTWIAVFLWNLWLIITRGERKCLGCKYQPYTNNNCRFNLSRFFPQLSKSSMLKMFKSLINIVILGIIGQIFWDFVEDIWKGGPFYLIQLLKSWLVLIEE